MSDDDLFTCLLAMCMSLNYREQTDGCQGKGFRGMGVNGDGD